MKKSARICAALGGALVALSAVGTACAAESVRDRTLFSHASPFATVVAICVVLLLGCLAWILAANLRQKRLIAKLQENDRALAYKNDYDELTGLLSKRRFYEAARKMIDEHPDTQYAIVRWDLSRFKVFNDLYGIAAGDQLLRDLGKAQRDDIKPGMLCGRLDGDHFAYCLPAEGFDPAKMHEHISDWFDRYDSSFEFVPNIGVYLVRDRGAAISLMCDWALLALRSVKGSYHQRFAYYDDSMRDKLILEQQTIADMRVAIEQEQFVLYFQPQFNFETGAVFGAEALVRWKHPTRGMIPPGEFIPAFEKSGFITEMDRHVWRLTCRYIRKWMNEGERYVPITVSVNVSRIDINNPGLVADVMEIVREYDIPVEMLKLEITESAYVENKQQLIEMVKSFKAHGFTVEMDDFGSGYSSLNTLKDVPVDILKLDLAFLAGDEHTGRGGNILSSVIRMARWLDMPVIAEGVETFEQAQYLKSIGCVLMQGYYFARPMPAEEFETFIRRSDLGKLRSPDDDSFQDFDELWDPRSPSAKLFTNFIGGAAILEYAGGNLEALRINDKCFRIFGLTRESYTQNGLQMLKRISEEDVPAFTAALRQATETRAETECDVRTRVPGEKGITWLRTRLQLIAKADRSCLYFVSIEDITEQKRLSMEVARANAQMQVMMETMPGGVFRFVADDTEALGYLSPGLLRMLGYTEQELRSLCENRFSPLVYEEDRARVVAELRSQPQSNADVQCEFRVVTKGGDIRWIYAVSRLERDEEDRPWLSVLVTDIDREKRMRETMLKERERYRIIVEESGTALFEWNYQDGSFYHSASYDQLYMSLLDSRTLFTQKFDEYEIVHPQDVEAFSEFLNSLKGGSNVARCTLRIRMIDKTYKWAHITIAFLRGDTGERTHAIGTIGVIDEIKQIELTQRWQEERYRILMEDLNVATFDYDPAANVMTRVVNIAGQGMKEKVISDYTTRVHHSSVIHPDSVHIVLEALEEAVRSPVSACVEFVARYGGGAYRWVRARYVSLEGELGGVDRVIGKIDDIQEIKEIEQNAVELKHIADIDGVTGLLTRAAFERAALLYLQSDRNSETLGAMIMLDIDNFKKANDEFGHIVGDKVLRDAADKTRESFRREDIIGRIGGDEFMVLMTRMPGKETLTARLNQLLASLRKATLPDGRTVTGSIGAVYVKPGDADFQALYQQADDALYLAKKAGKNQFAVKE